MTGQPAQRIPGGLRTMHGRGWYNMACWNGLSSEQQHRLVEHGNLPIGYVPMGRCRNGAEVCVETRWDNAPGPRFYCTECAIRFLRVRRAVATHKQ